MLLINKSCNAVVVVLMVNADGCMQDVQGSNPAND